MTTQLITLHPCEPVEFDHDVLERLCEVHGQNAEAVIARLLTHIEKALRLAEHQMKKDEWSGFRRTCDDLIRLSGELGMRTLEAAAWAVIDCLDNRQAAALPACAARMLRLGQPETINHWTVQTGTGI